MMQATREQYITNGITIIYIYVLYGRQMTALKNMLQKYVL
ncbi:hypothetical protein SAMN05216365_13343 [Porphyromonadaceae bacterium NLAE-zl-C104]|nr:hypothetical protein SAMN05216365_13343 [Porphyromonadaceae bacterium NLAE-zl-C104]